jgi:RHS repeat-associated protein
MPKPSQKGPNQTSVLTAASPMPKTGLNLFGEATESQDALGNVTRHEFNEFGHHKKVTYPTYTPPGGTAITPTELYSCDVNTALLSSVTGRNGAVTSYVYEPWADRTLKVSYADGTFSQYAYDDPANMVTAQTGAGVTVLQTSVSKLDGLNRTFETTLSDAGEVSRVNKAEFDGAGRVLRSTDALNYVYANAYDRAGGLLETTAPDATATVTNVFDLLGRLDTSTDALGRIRKTNYGTDQRVASVQSKSAAGVVMESATYTYNISGRSTTTTNLRGDTSVQLRDALGQTVEARQNLTSATDYMSTLYGYDLVGSMTRLTDGRGKLTTYTYNPWNLRESLVEPGTEVVTDRTWTTGYNVAGLPVKDVEPGGTQTARTYDNMNRLKTVTGTDPDPTLNASKSFGYDTYGRLNSFGSPDGVKTVTYTGFGQLAAVNNGSSFTYDQRGLMASRTDAAGTSTFGWTAKGELDTQTIAGRGQLHHIWNGGELRTTWFNTAAGDATYTKRDYGYDGIGRMTAELVRKNAAAVAWSAYSYDTAGNVLSQQFGLPGNPGAGTHLYAYDNAARLTGWTKPGTPTPIVYTYDKAGNRTSAAGITYTYDDHNRVTNSSDGSVFTYTKRGTLATETKAGVTTNSWTDALGRVVQTGANLYTYDDWDRIIQRTGTSIDATRGPAPQAGTTTLPGVTTTVAPTTIAPTTVPGPTPTTIPRQPAPQANQATFSYAGLEKDPVSDRGQSFFRTPSGRPVAITTNTSPETTDGFRWIGTNRHGDITQLLDPNQTNPLTGTQTFDPFGQPLSAAVIRLGYQGNWTEPDTKQPWMQARWYQPKTATFTNRDTLLGNIGGPAVGHNRYTYAANNPLLWVDPSGHSNCMDFDCRLSDKSYNSRIAQGAANIASSADTPILNEATVRYFASLGLNDEDTRWDIWHLFTTSVAAATDLRLAMAGSPGSADVQAEYERQFKFSLSTWTGLSGGGRRVAGRVNFKLEVVADTALRWVAANLGLYSEKGSGKGPLGIRLLRDLDAGAGRYQTDVLDSLACASERINCVNQKRSTVTQIEFLSGFIPGFGEGMALGQAITGQDWNGDRLSTDQRAVMIAMIVAGESIGKLAGRAAKPGTTAIETGENTVYRSVSASGEINYVGRTNNIGRRALEHLRIKGIRVEAIPNLTTLSLEDARAVEQVMIENYGGANGPQLLNLINSISPTRDPAFYKNAIARGCEILKATGNTVHGVNVC